MGAMGTAAEAAAAAPSAWSRRVGGLPSSFWYLWSGTLVNRLGSFVGPFLALYLTGSRGFSVAESGLVLTAFGIGSAVSQPLGGALADRIGRRATMVLGLTAAAVSLLALGLASTLPALLATAAAYGLCLDLFRPAVQAAIADVVDEPHRARAYALQFWAINLGFAVAVPLGGVLAERGYWLLFTLDAATSLVFAVLIARRVPESRPERVPGEDPGSVREVLGDRLLLLLVGCVVLHATVYLQVFTTLPLVVVRDGLGGDGFGLVLGLNGLLIVVLQPLLLGVLARRSRGRLLLLASLLQGGGLALHGLAGTLVQHMGAVAVWTTGEVLQAGLLAAVVASLAPLHLRGRYMGAFGFSFGAASALAPLLGTQLLDRGGEGPLWLACLLASAVAGVGLLRVSAAAEGRARRYTQPDRGRGTS